jgi:LPPG:FO 2-phospho-L-lactate transferase
LTGVTQKLCSNFGIELSVLPMSDQPAPTMMNTDQGLMPFQTWFVEQKWQPAVREVLLPDVISTAQVVSCLENADLILIAPSNPFVSIDPILNAYPVRSMLAEVAELVVAVSPIIAGEAVKGPAAKMMGELGMSVSSAAIAQYYGDFIDVFVFDRQDNALFKQEGSLNSLVTFQTDTFMKDRQDRSRLAQEILNFSMELLSS